MFLVINYAIQIAGIVVLAGAIAELRRIASMLEHLSRRYAPFDESERSDDTAAPLPVAAE